MGQTLGWVPARDQDKMDKVIVLMESSDTRKRSLEKLTRVIIITESTEALLCARYCAKCFVRILSLSPCNNPLRQNRYRHCICFADEETKAQRG